MFTIPQVKASEVLFFYGVRLVAIVALILPFFSGNRYEDAPLHLPGVYYELLRWGICAVLVMFACFAYALRRTPWVWTLGITALIFNPLAQFRVGLEVWHCIDGLTALLLFATFFTLRETSPKP